MRLRRLCLEIFALRRFFKEPIAGVSVCRASEAQPKHRLSEIANAFDAKSPGQPARGGGRTPSELTREHFRSPPAENIAGLIRGDTGLYSVDSRMEKCYG